MRHRAVTATSSERHGCHIWAVRFKHYSVTWDDLARMYRLFSVLECQYACEADICADTPGDGARSTDRSINMCAVGRVVADTLNAAGINTLHDETLNDYPSYTGSYENSRAVVQRYLAQYPSIKVVLDVHRDAIERENGTRCAPVCTIDGRQAAQVMIICGCDNGTSVQLPAWRQNLRFAAAWERSMEAKYPGLTRPVLFSYRFYNQDLTTGSLLIEIGGHGNNLNEALYAGYLAAQGLADALLS
mgnify:CR=1 FL=1